MSNLLKSEFLTSLKADLLDRRLLPIVALVFVGLAAALAYVVLGSGSSSTATVAGSPQLSTSALPTHGVSATQTQTSTVEAVAETTNGGSRQHAGKAHNPFNALPGAGKAASAGSSSSSSHASSGAGTSSAGSTSGSGSGEASKTSSTPASTPVSTPTKHKKTASKPKKAYDVSVLFGELPAGTTAVNAQLQAYQKLKLATPLPEKQPLVIFRGVTAGGKSATFTVYGEVILHGEGNCLPSASQCQAIDLRAGQSEQLEYLPLEGAAVTYELRVVSISQASATSARLEHYLRSESRAGRRLLRDAGLLALPGMHYGRQIGVLVFDGHSAFGSRAHFTARIALQGAPGGI
jgi:hypothetical protein